MLWFAIEGGTHIKQNHGSVCVRNQSRDSRTKNSLHSASGEHADSEGRTGVAHGDYSVSLTPRGQLKGYPQRRVLFPAEAPARSVLHFDDIRSMMNVDVRGQPPKQ